MHKYPNLSSHIEICWNLGEISTLKGWKKIELQELNKELYSKFFKPLAGASAEGYKARKCEYLRILV